jgi:sterol desaturase/sphingolipid hydroxylase (fatty acid hydroxylase superfamily)
VDLAWLGLWGAVPVVVTTTFLTYWSHRIQHRFDLLWRLGHQLHHSVARVDIASAMIFHPIDLMVQVTMTTIAAWLIGATPGAAALGGGAGFVIALFQHWNVATPRWTGWLIQRPEMHMLHHERGVHHRNFGDMPVWDMIFGTYANPATADVEVGFGEGRGRRVLAMILCRDVHADMARGRVR